MASKARIGVSHAPLAALAALALGLVLAQPASATPTPSSCPAANCVSNDMEVLAVAAAAVGDPTCTDTNDTVDIEVTHTITPQGGSTRYDVGLYTAIDGVGQQCLADVLEAPQATGGFFDDEGDDCGDINGEVTHVQTYTVPCTDDNDNGLLDVLLICQSWANQPNQVQSCNESIVIEGTAAHCNCLQVNANVPIGAPAMNRYGYAALALLLLSAGVIFVRKVNLI